MNLVLCLPFDVVQEIWWHLGRIDLQSASLVVSVFRNCSQGELESTLRFGCGLMPEPLVDLVSIASAEGRYEMTRVQQELRLNNLSLHPCLLSYIYKIDTEPNEPFADLMSRASTEERCEMTRVQQELRLNNPSRHPPIELHI